MTLRARLLVAMGVVAGLLIAASYVITHTATTQIVGQLDAQLSRFAGDTPGPDRWRVSGLDTLDTTANIDNDVLFTTLYVGVYDGDAIRTLAYPARGVDSGDPPRVSRSTAEELASQRSYKSVPSNSGESNYRVTARYGFGGNLILYGAPLDDAYAALDELTLLQVTIGTSLLIIFGLLSWWVLRLGVRPLVKMTGTAEQIAAGDLSVRVDVAPDGTEARQLGDALNTMMEHIEHSFAERAATEERLRQFLADAAHELKTPLTTIRTYTEMYRLGVFDSDDSERRGAVERTEAEAVRMANLLDDMMMLARLDQTRQIDEVVVDVGGIVDNVVTDTAAVHDTRQVTSCVDGDVYVIGDAEKLHQVVANLCNNAATHTDGDIEVECRTDNGHVIIDVVDHGEGVDADVARHAFERFYRGDPSRSRDSGGSGLGLAIVAAIVERHNGTVELFARDENDPHGVGTTARVVLPRATEPGAHT